MPVTAKLSKAFYDQFGDAVTAELVKLLNEVDANAQQSWRDMSEQRCGCPSGDEQADGRSDALDGRHVGDNDDRRDRPVVSPLTEASHGRRDDKRPAANAPLRTPLPPPRCPPHTFPHHVTQSPAPLPAPST